MINIKNISKIYRTQEVETHALNQVDLEIKEGEFLAIMGPSGCGKSTLLNILGFLDSPTKGEYHFLNQSTAQYSSKDKTQLRRENIGFIFQNFNLIDELSVYENVELPLLYANVPKKERKEWVESILNDLEIGHRIKHYPQQLSGGQQQRVAVARALVNKPKLILADEPTGNLDSKNGNDVMNILSELHVKGSTIAMVTHSSYDAGFASRIVEMKDGQIFSERSNQKKVEVFTQD